jgi:hypothetical protein
MNSSVSSNVLLFKPRMISASSYHTVAMTQQFILLIRQTEMKACVADFYVVTRCQIVFVICAFMQESPKNSLRLSSRNGKQHACALPVVFVVVAVIGDQIALFHLNTDHNVCCSHAGKE